MKALLGAVIAGGESRRYGSPKALARVGGTRIIDRVVDALGRVVPDVVLLANEPELFQDLGLDSRPDIQSGQGVLGGLLTGLLWARERGQRGILALACDMPFPSVPVLERLRDLADSADVVVPESQGRRGIEPLCAAYGIGCIPAIESSLEAGDRRMIGFHDQVSVRRVPFEQVEALCDPDRAFLNVNTPEDQERAETMAGGDA